MAPRHTVIARCSTTPTRATLNSVTPSPATSTLEQLLGPLNEVERKHAPGELHLAGDASLLESGVRVAIVGSRKASETGLTRARILADALVKRGITVVSGLAEGVDAAAHTQAIAAGGRTIAVLGTPLDEFYPKANRALQERIMAEHLAVSQFASGTKTQPNHFPLRNRTMALISDATVIVEAAERSGTVHQAWEALRLGRLLFLMESLASNTELTWPAQLIHYGAQVLTRESLPEMLEHLPERSCDSTAAF